MNNHHNMKSLHSIFIIEVVNLKRQLFSLLVCVFLIVSSCSIVLTYAQAPAGDGIVEVEVPVRGTFLHAVEYWPWWGPGTYEYDVDLELEVGKVARGHIENPAIVDLVANGFSPGDMVTISFEGGYHDAGSWNPVDPGPIADIETLKIAGVFSVTSELKPSNERERVPGAIDAGEDYDTGKTYWSNDMQARYEELR
jgi:hypothetical protein